jgi:uncharacterized protein (TIGR02391 family)
MKTEVLIEKLHAFLTSLEEHKDLYFSSLRSGYVIKNHGLIEKQEQELTRQFGAIELYIRKYSHLVTYEGATGTHQDPWINALMANLPSRKGPALQTIIKEVNRIIGLLEAIEAEEILLEDLSILLDSMKLHGAIVRVSKRAFAGGMYAEAILNAFKEVIVQVRKTSGLHELDGTPLMQQAFSVHNPRIKLNNLQTQSEKDEQAGFLSIFIGVALGIRNPAAHDNIEQEDPYKALEYLSLASLLLKKLDERIQPIE